MCRDTMLHNNNVKLFGLNKLINMLGLNEKDVNIILMNKINDKKKADLSMGPDIPYTSTYYGTISIKDF